MNELQMISEMLDETPAEQTAAQGRRRLLSEIANPRPAAPARRRFPLPRWSPGLGLAGLAGVAAASVAVAVAVSGTTSPAPQSPGQTATGELSARTILVAAAEQAESTTETTGKYWHTATIDRHSFRVGKGDGAYTVVWRQRSEGWTPSTPGGKQYGRQQDLGATPATPADTAAWRRAGSPATFSVSVPVGPGSKVRKPLKLKTQPGSPHLSGSPLVDRDKVFWLGRNVTVKDLRALPADPAKLKASLLKWYRGHGTESSGQAMTSDAWLFEVTRGLIVDMPVTPKVRGAAFRMLADLDTVKAIGPVRDGEGRTGTAVATTERTPNGVLEHRLIIDQRRGTALGTQIVVVRPAGANAALPAGATLVSTSVMAGGWTDTGPR
ncbi:hypothetical protein SAMN04489712_12423 [Thermomonospora echinospora]|uniref:CU044_5270 family protein n=1 Tax=Thermomonospora echinospora TaxID=1992 RepID=A0A1H6DX68_9ACTN|nr:CU044_5270 family protein [Thermomonospora echinospora]SEG89674.1 hypothetical protein SAMN04489712_12423 [Thermomonospora echinospora]